MLSGWFPGIASHLLAASVMNAPAGLILSKILLPETGDPVTRAGIASASAAVAEAPPKPGRWRYLRFGRDTRDSSVIEAAANGAAQGAQLAINVAAMLMAFIALVALLNFLLGLAGGLAGMPELSLQVILGFVLRPLAWVMGVPWADTAYVGSLIGLKATLNEFVAYAQFGADLGAGQVLQPRSAIILTYALLGFANLSSSSPSRSAASAGSRRNGRARSRRWG
jgi:concentrative nucleoside transporter, CNT family